MAKIKQLSEDLIKKIAAGEVVERPANVVKELVENSLDASATNIEINITNGGKSNIKIIDNGVGMSKEDIMLSVLPHTTSKISNFEDLVHIRSFGFRGEALASISSVSKTTISSRESNSNVGYEYKVWLNQLTPKAMPIGTTVQVEDIFYNVLARRKFLKSEKTEYKHVLEIAYSLSLVNMEVAFKFVHNNKTIFSTQAREDLKERIFKLFKYPIQELVTLDKKDSQIHVVGELLQASKTFDYPAHFVLILNNRVIYDRGVYRAILGSFSRVLPEKVKPSGVIKINVPETWVDFNVHPRKTQIRFVNPYRVYAILKRIFDDFITQTFSKHGVISNTTINLPKPSYKNLFLEDSGKISTKASSIESYPTADIQSTKQSKSVFMPADGFSSAMEEFEDESFIEKLKIDDVRNIVQLANRYILVEIKDKFIFIDQHAAAERVKFEQLQAQLKKSKEPVQHLLTPIVFDDLEIDELVQALLDDLRRIGFSILVNENTVTVNGIPTFLDVGEAKIILVQVLKGDFDGLDGIKTVKNIKDYLTATRACHTSIRANRRLNKEEIMQLVKDLFECEIPSSCPHGRPTYWVLMQKDLDLKFWRTY